LPKEEEAIEHNIRNKDLEGSSNIAIYTDASVMEKGKGVGVGFISYFGTLCPPNLQAKGEGITNLGLDQLVYNGELEGIAIAVEFASQIAYPGVNINIYSDNQAGLYRLKTPSDNPGQSHQIRVWKSARDAKEKGAKIALNWVPGHTEVIGNEKADSLAKDATKNPPDSRYTSLAMLGLRIKALDNKEWKAFYLGLKDKSTYAKIYDFRAQRKIPIPLGTRRVYASALFQLKLGHGYFKSYLRRFRYAKNSLCQCGHIETPEHLLLSCNRYTEERNQLQKTLKTPKKRLSLRLLLHTKPGIEATLAFIRETKIATRQWRLERAQGEEEEEEEEESLISFVFALMSTFFYFLIFIA
jgi:ribonuclease HI